MTNAELLTYSCSLWRKIAETSMVYGLDYQKHFMELSEMVKIVEHDAIPEGAGLAATVMLEEALDHARMHLTNVERWISQQDYHHVGTA